MSRYKGPRLKINRKLGQLPGLTRKTSKKSNSPGEHGQKAKKASEYALRLEEKQKIKFNYGIHERQLLKYMKLAKKAQGPTGSILLQMIEMRLDNTVFRMGLAPTIPAARQIINHGHIIVNKKKLNICSHDCDCICQHHEAAATAASPAPVASRSPQKPLSGLPDLFFSETYGIASRI